MMKSCIKMNIEKRKIEDKRTIKDKIKNKKTFSDN